MGKVGKTCLQTILKVVNSIMGLVGIAVTLYSLWIARVWQRGHHSSSYDSTTAPWFIYTCLSIGVTLCIITCIGHISADSSNAFCLSCYTVMMLVLLLLETAAAADILLNSDWEKDLPEDPTGKFHDFKDFVTDNFDFFKWLGLLILLAQGSSLLLGMALNALKRSSHYDTDDEYLPTRIPLINHNLRPPPPPYVVGDPMFASKNDVWKNTAKK